MSDFESGDDPVILNPKLLEELKIKMKENPNIEYGIPLTDCCDNLEYDVLEKIEKNPDQYNPMVRPYKRGNNNPDPIIFSDYILCITYHMSYANHGGYCSGTYVELDDIYDANTLKIKKYFWLPIQFEKNVEGNHLVDLYEASKEKEKNIYELFSITSYHCGGSGYCNNVCTNYKIVKMRVKKSQESVGENKREFEYCFNKNSSHQDVIIFGEDLTEDDYYNKYYQDFYVEINYDMFYAQHYEKLGHDNICNCKKNNEINFKRKYYLPLYFTEKNLKEKINIFNINAGYHESHSCLLKTSYIIKNFKIIREYDSGEVLKNE